MKTALDLTEKVSNHCIENRDIMHFSSFLSPTFYHTQKPTLKIEKIHIYLDL